MCLTIWNAGADDVPTMVQAVTRQKKYLNYKHCESAKKSSRTSNVRSIRFLSITSLACGLRLIKKRNGPSKKHRETERKGFML